MAFNIDTQFDSSFVEIPVAIDEYKNEVDSLKKQIENCNDPSLELTSKVKLGEYLRVLNQLEESQKMIEEAFELARDLKAGEEFFKAKMIFAFLNYNLRKFYKCDEDLQKCIDTAKKNSKWFHYLPKIYLYFALNKKAQRQEEVANQLVKDGISAAIASGNLQLLETLKKMIS